MRGSWCKNLAETLLGLRNETRATTQSKTLLPISMFQGMEDITRYFAMFSFMQSALARQINVALHAVCVDEIRCHLEEFLLLGITP